MVSWYEMELLLQFASSMKLNYISLQSKTNIVDLFCVRPLSTQKLTFTVYLEANNLKTFSAFFHYFELIEL